jgi:hypothetical protein
MAVPLLSHLLTAPKAKTASDSSPEYTGEMGLEYVLIESGPKRRPQPVNYP